MRKAYPLVLVLVLLIVAAAMPAAAVTVKLASLAPDGSVWDLAIEEMGAEWAEATDGRVRLRVYPGGVAGDEPDVVRKMRIGQLHAAALTVGGLTEIDDAFRVFAIPMFFDSYEELYYVIDRMTPELSKRLEGKGYVLLNWAHAGWIHLFSTEPVTSLEQLKKTKFFVGAGDDRAVQWWKNNGYRPVPLAMTDILTGLQTGMIEALPSPPLAALLLQRYKQAPNMLDLGLAPLVGATIIQKRVWQRIDEADRRSLLAAAAELGETLEREVPGQDAESVAEMEKRGLKVVRVDDPAKLASYREAAEEFAERVRGDRLPPEILQLAQEARDAYRSQQDGGETPATGGARP
jgi:TRAP-type C4-dicarboxylate transport system substrate-binding protein